MIAEFKWLRTPVQMLAQPRRRSLRLFSLILIAACASLPSQPRVQPLYWGFTGPWDPRSDASIESNGHALARVVTGWIALATTTIRPPLAGPDTHGSHPALAARQ